MNINNNVLIFPITKDFEDDIWVDMNYSLTEEFYSKKENNKSSKHLSRSNWTPRIVD